MSLTIKRFSLRLERRGGTGWGSERESIMAAAQSTLPSQIANALADRLDTDEDVEITEPLRLRVRLSLSELAEACRSESGMRGLAARLVADAPPLSQLAGTERRAEAPAPPGIMTTADGEMRHQDLSATTLDTPDVVAVLVDLYRAATLHQVLGRLPEVALRHWFAVVRDRAQVSNLAAAPGDAGELRAALAAIVIHLADGTPAPVPVVTAAAAEARVVSAPALELEPRSESALSSAAHRTAKRRAQTPRVALRHTRAAAHEAVTATLDGLALPFLLLRPLSGSGYLDVAAASFGALDRSDELVRFASALAFQVLDVPARGWNYDAKTLATVAGFSGHLTPLGDALDGTAALCGPLDAMLAQLQMQGRDDRQPLLLHVDVHGALLVDCNGLLPITWQATLEELLAIVGPTRSRVIVPAASVGPTTLDVLGAAGVRFVTEAPPARHEHWRRVAGVRAWTNDRDTADRELASFAASFTLDEDVDQLVKLLVARQLRGGDSAVARSVAVAAAVALGDLADRLWRDREPTSPQLALGRFADLSARITLAPDRVDVAVPRGARFRDLERAGFLGTFAPPWLDGRPLTIGAA